MRKLIVTLFTSLDGVIEAPGGEQGYRHAGWVGPYFSRELGAYKEREQLAAEVLLLGRKTYEGFAGAWPGRDGAMADKINTMRKCVVGSKIDPTYQGSEQLAFADVARVRAETGGPILVAGSKSLVHALFDAGLVDELHLQVFPTILGEGFRWAPTQLRKLTLNEALPMPNGVVCVSYAVAS